MKRLILIASIAMFTIAMAISVNVDSAKNEFALENAQALAKVKPTVGYYSCGSGDEPCAHCKIGYTHGMPNGTFYMCSRYD